MLEKTDPRIAPSGTAYVSLRRCSVRIYLAKALLLPLAMLSRFGRRPLVAMSRLIRYVVGLAVVCPIFALARPMEFNLPAQPAADALLAFSQQAKSEVLFSYEDLRQTQSTAVSGRYEPEDALRQLLTGTGFTARRNFRGKFVVSAGSGSSGVVEGQVLTPNGEPLRDVRVSISGLHRPVTTDAQGRFHFERVPAGSHQLLAVARGFRPLQLPTVTVEAGAVTALGRQTLEAVLDPARLDPYIVEERPEHRRPFDRNATPPAPRTAAGNLDLRRTEGDALPYTVFDRGRIMLSGVVDLNSFLSRELLENSAVAASAESDDETAANFGGNNLSLRGYNSEETIILVNGRRLPEFLTTFTKGNAPPDVNFIPLSLVQRVEVLPASASALYSGNAVGGVINIVLRPDVDVANATEVTTTYTNAWHGYDAPQSSASLMHGRSFLGGKLRLRFNANFGESLPPTEAELGYRRQRVETTVSPQSALHRATPNVRSATLAPLFGPGSSPMTSVAPGANGFGGLAAFTGRNGVRNEELFDGAGGFTASINSTDYAYGWRQRRAAWFLSSVYDVSERLQIGFDGIYSRASLTRGYELLQGDLLLAADSPLNPFGQDVRVALNESAPLLGDNHRAARVDFSSVVLGALVELPWDWRAMADVQYARNIVRYRGVHGLDAQRWQQLVNEQRYNPLRDTQVFGPPDAFYDEVLIFQGRRGEYSPVGDYNALDAAIRLTRERLPLPTGEGLLNIGGDYRRSEMKDYLEVHHYGDGTVAGDPIQWRGRTLERVSAFGELQAPLLPSEWLPSWLRRVETDLAARYIAADTSQETNIAPTYGLKVEFAGGFSARGSVTTSNRYPNPQMTRPGGTGPGAGGTTVTLINDPRRGEQYDVPVSEVINPGLEPGNAVTQTFGFGFHAGERHQFRSAIDFFDTRMTNEPIFIHAQYAVNWENLWPERVERAPAQPGETAGPVTSVTTGRINAAWRRSQHWSTSLNYTWDGCLGGTLELYARWMYFQRFDLQVLPIFDVVDQLDAPDGGMPGLLRHRTNFGAAWSNRLYGFGIDGRYFHSCRIPRSEWSLQGRDHIDSHWQFDAFAHTDLKRWLPWKNSRHGLRAQLRVSNLFGPDFPYYWATGVQPYGDWRGRTYSLSLTAVF
jgi:iron complex outermembrane recepter protein